MRVLGVPIEPPQTVVARIAADLSAIARVARTAPATIDRLLALGEEIAGTGRALLELGERLDRRAVAVLALGERIDARAEGIQELGERIDARGGELLETGTEIRDVGRDMHSRGGEIVDRATKVVETGNELIAVLPTLERALEMATPLEGAIDRFGRLVDRLPGGASRRRSEPRGERDATAPPDHSTDPPADPPSR